MTTTDVDHVQPTTLAKDNSADLVALGGELIPPAEMKREYRHRTGWTRRKATA